MGWMYTHPQQFFQRATVAREVFYEICAHRSEQAYLSRGEWYMVFRSAPILRLYTVCNAVVDKLDDFCSAFPSILTGQCREQMDRKGIWTRLCCVTLWTMLVQAL